MGVQFNEPASSGRGAKRESFFIRLVMGTGLVKTSGAAQAVLFIIAIILLALSGYFFMHGNEKPPVPTKAQIQL